jgi:hypothetical protein
MRIIIRKYLLRAYSSINYEVILKILQSLRRSQQDHFGRWINVPLCRLFREEENTGRLNSNKCHDLERERVLQLRP